MNAEMKRIQAGYVDRLRRSMRGISPEVIDELEREIVDHIEDSLADRGEQTVGALLDVLERLGPPEEYASDLGLYAMVDRGYRDWSVPNMIRSTAFWSMGTMAGAIALFSFGLLFLAGAVLALAGLMRALPAGLYAQVAGTPAGADRQTALVPGIAIFLVGLLALGLVTGVVRWFVGEYVHMARPRVLGGGASDPGWSRRASRRIVVLAASGLAAALAAWCVLYVAYATGAGEAIGVPRSPSPPSDSPVALVFLVVEIGGVVLFLLSPILGLLWTRAAEARTRRGTGST